VTQSLFSLDDAASSLRDYQGKVDFSPERINQIEERLSLIQSLRKKYGDTIEDILAYVDKPGAISTPSPPAMRRWSA
jgi:DNA repair protein RecN (Recombination protein N)